MSYRHDIRIKLTTEDFIELKKEFADYLEQNERTYNMLEKLDKFVPIEIWSEDDNGNEILVPGYYFGWDFVKWDDELDFIQDFVTTRKQYAITKIGEEPGDIEQLAQLFDTIWTRTIFDDECEE